MRKGKGLCFLLTVMMLLSMVPFSTLPAKAAGGTVEVATWEEL